MSSHRISVSGQRDQSISTGSTHNSAQYPAKPGDSAQITLGNFEEFIVSLPPNAVVERYTKGDEEYLVLRVASKPYDDSSDLRGAVGLSITAIGHDAERNSWPHTNIDVRKQTGDPLNWISERGYTLDDTIALDELAKE